MFSIIEIFIRYIVEDINNLIIVEPLDNGVINLAKGKIICNFRLKYCDIVEINKYQPKTLVLRNTYTFKNEGSKDENNNSSEFILCFEDENLTSYASDFLKKNKREIKKLELALIIKILHSSENDLLPTNNK